MPPKFDPSQVPRIGRASKDRRRHRWFQDPTPWLQDPTPWLQGPTRWFQDPAGPGPGRVGVNPRPVPMSTSTQPTSVSPPQEPPTVEVLHVGGQDPPNPSWWIKGKVIDIADATDWEKKCKFIKNTNHNTLVVVEFQAPWCGPSRFIAPFIQRQAEVNKDVLFVRLNYDEMEGVASMEGVDVVPTFILYKAGKKMPNPIVGARRGDLSKEIEKLKN